MSEIASLRLDDLLVDGDRPHLRIRATVAKCGRARRVPLWWDAGTLDDLCAWKAERLAQGASGQSLVISPEKAGGRPRPFSRHTLRRRFQRACQVLGSGRLRTQTIHHGRHTFVSHALAGGRTLAEVRDAAGHSIVLVTSAYLHVAVDDDDEADDLFKYE